MTQYNYHRGNCIWKMSGACAGYSNLYDWKYPVLAVGWILHKGWVYTNDIDHIYNNDGGWEDCTSLLFFQDKLNPSIFLEKP